MEMENDMKKRTRINKNGGMFFAAKDGDLSVLRNPILANIFHRLNLTEKFGTGRGTKYKIKS